MTLNDYQDEAAKTRHISPKLFMLNANGEYVAVPYAYPALGLGEAGEVQNKIKKIMRDNDGIVTKDIREAVKGELGGLLWYVAMTAKEMGLTLYEVGAYNILQLQDRAERGVLQGNGDNR